MARRYTGGLLSSKEQVTDANSASGIFSVQEAGALTAAGSFPTGRWTPQRSLRFRAANQNYLNRTFGTPTNNKVWTWSAWIKRGSLTLADADHLFFASPTDVGGNPSTYARLVFETDGTLRLQSNASAGELFTSSALFRDPSSWYHIVLYMDAVNTTVRCYVNGKEITYASRTNPTNTNTAINGSGNHHRMGFFRTAEPRPMDGYMADVNFIDGQALDPSQFGTTDPQTGVWVPKRYAGTYGNNGFYLDFRDNTSTTNLALDRSGNSNNWTPNNFSVSGATATTVSFTSVGTTSWTVPPGITSVNYLVVAGGGAGGSAGPTMYDGGAAGGGAGGMLYGTMAVTPGTVYSVYVGAGASGAANRTRGASGDNSVLSSSSTSITAIGGGGGGGGANTTSGANGGSGGGGANGGAAGLGTAGQGNNGGYYVGSPGNGGGGAGGVGGSATGNTGANGGAGLQWPVNSTTYAGGGGGGGYQLGGGSGGSSIGGAGGSNNSNGSGASASTGSGGGGSGGTYNTTGTLTGGSGANGIIIVSYATIDSTYDSMVDVPGIAAVTSQPDWGGVQRGNYPVLSPVSTYNFGGTLSNGNLSVSYGDTANNKPTMGAISGKWYTEITCTSSGGYSGTGLSVAVTSTSFEQAFINAWYYSNGQTYNYGTDSYVSYGATWGTGDIIGVAWDCDNGNVTFYKNGVSQGLLTANREVRIVPTSTVGSAPYPTAYATGVTSTFTINYGQRPFRYFPPAGFKSLCSTNLPNPVIKRPSDHFDVKTYTGNGTALTVGTVAKQSSAYPINKSLRFRSSASAYLNRTPAVAGNRKTWTYSTWLKRGAVGAEGTIISGGATTGRLCVFFNSSGQLVSDIGGTGTYDQSTAVYRDPSAWYHFVWQFDTTQATAANRSRMYINGVQVTLTNTRTFTQNADYEINNSVLQTLGTFSNSIGTYNFDGYQTETNFIDGQSLTPASFGAFDANNNWVPQRYTGTYGTNGYYLPMNTTAAGFSGYYGEFNLTPTAQYISVPDSTAIQFQTGNFTQECYFYLKGPNPGSGAYYSIWGSYDDVSTGQYMHIDDAGRLTWGTNGSLLITTASAVPKYQWNHIALVRSTSTLVTLYLNGKNVGSINSGSGNLITGVPFRIGSLSNAYPRYFPGLISNFRYTKSAVYTAEFVPPTGTLTAIANTQLLLLTGASATTDGSTNNMTVTNVGTVTTKAGNVGAYVSIGNDASGNNDHWDLVAINPQPAAVEFRTPGTTTWTAPPGITSVNYLVVAGGGGGGYSIGGGGGAGGLLQGKLDVTPGTSYTVTVGAGGAGNTGSGGGIGTSGGNSVFSTITTVGGGGGGGNSSGSPGQDGGSGGGAGEGAYWGVGTAGQGFRGGQAYDAGQYYGSGGGGGAGGVGQDGTSSKGGNGGPGLASFITGLSKFYAGGGGGGYYPTGGSQASGGSGIGGASGAAVTSSGGAGSPSTGSGGGGGSNTAFVGSGGDGANGIVILSYGAGNDSTYDSPTDNVIDMLGDNGGTGNYCTLDAANNNGLTISDGGLKWVGAAATPRMAYGTLPFSRGKWYFEYTMTQSNSGGNWAVGLSQANVLPASGSTPFANPNTWGVMTGGNETVLYKVSNNVFTNLSGLWTGSLSGAVIGVAVDYDAGKVWFSKSNVWVEGDPSAGTTPSYTGINAYGELKPIVYGYNTSDIGYANFGQTSFTYTPPTGFKALNSKNLKDVGSYNLPDTFGNFVNTPDLVWIKNRTSASGGGLFNTVIGPTRFLQTSNNNGLATTSGELEAFLPNGFLLGANGNITNNSGNSYVGWAWNKGKTPGFDMVTYSGNSTNGRMIPHNLGQVPAFYITKCLTSYNSSNGVADWNVWHKSVDASAYGGSKTLYLMNDIAAGAAGGYFANPTSSEFSPNQTLYDNVTGVSYIAYLWAEVPGFSKMGSWSGLSDTRGPFIYTGFRPRWIMTKRYTSTGNWLLLDTARNQFNDTTATIVANGTSSEGTGAGGNWGFDILSNGFKIRGLNSEINTSGQSYIYVAFAESPFKYANAR